MVFDPVNKVVVSLEVGERNNKTASKLIADVKSKSDGNLPLFTSDKHKPYEKAILENYGVDEKTERTRKVGRPKKPKKILPAELKYAQVIKHRRNGKVVKIETKVVFGKKEEVENALSNSSVSNQINTAFIERQNLTFRQGNGRLSRKSLNFSKDLEMLICQLWLFLGYYHFVRPHLALRIENCIEKRRWLQRTPMVAVGITDHIWTLRELTTYHVPFNRGDLMT